MAHVYSQFDLDPGAGSEIVAALWLRFLRDSAGWTIPLSGVNGSGPTGDNLGSGYMTTTTDWVCMESPDTNRQFLFQRGSQPYYGNIWYSPGANFTGGSPTVRATASDEVIVNDSGAMFAYDPSEGGQVTYFADDTAPYGFYALGWTTNWSKLYVGVIFDPLTGVNVSDLDPYIWLIQAAGTDPPNFTDTGVGNESSSTGGVDRCVGTLSNGAYTGTIPGVRMRCDVEIIPYQGPRNLLDNDKYITWPIPYARRTGLANPGYKGIGTIARWSGWTVAPYGTTIGGRTFIIFGAIAVPWNGTQPLSGSYG
jgi:hypothetical protein